MRKTLTALAASLAVLLLTPLTALAQTAPVTTDPSVVDELAFGAVARWYPAAGAIFVIGVGVVYVVSARKYQLAEVPTE